MNNFEKIIKMTEKELAEFLSDIISCPNCPAKKECIALFCRDAIKLWLQQESEG